MWISKEEFEELKKQKGEIETLKFEIRVIKQELIKNGLIDFGGLVIFRSAYPVVENTKLLLKHFNLEVQETPSEKKLVKTKKGKK